jgi:hypothetical protein
MVHEPEDRASAYVLPLACLQCDAWGRVFTGRTWTARVSFVVYIMAIQSVMGGYQQQKPPGSLPALKADILVCKSFKQCQSNHSALAPQLAVKQLQACSSPQWQSKHSRGMQRSIDHPSSVCTVSKPCTACMPHQYVANLDLRPQLGLTACRLDTVFGVCWLGHLRRPH